MNSLAPVVDRDPESMSVARRVQFHGASQLPLVAIDLGAESCRVSLLTWPDGQPHIQVVHRFANAPVVEGNGREGTLRWDLRRICAGVNEGLRACADLAPQGIAAIGVDGWAVDYVRMNAAGQPLASPFCYRDQRTVAAQKEVLQRISAEDLYEFTGIQFQTLNTLYQLRADKDIPATAPWLNLPEYMLHSLGGDRVAEYTNATHTQMLRIDTRVWCAEIFAAANIDLSVAPRVVPPGTIVGILRGPLAILPAFRKTKLIAPACHDTASAVAGIPAQGDDWAFISSGTWSLVGCVLDAPCLAESARKSGFSNEGGIGGNINFLRSVNGMWMLQQCIQHWATEGTSWTWESLVEAASLLPKPEFFIDVDDPALVLPGDMPARINAQLERAGQRAITEAPAMASRIFHSLAAQYAKILRDLVSITGKRLRCIYVVGGGNRNAYLNRLTEEATGLQVLLGPTESSTVGNFAIQLAALSSRPKNALGVSADDVADSAARIIGGHPAAAVEARAG